jgi:hypothetical protein
MGQDIDRPITVWEEMFLTSEIGRRIADFTYTDSRGTERKLVSAVETVNLAEGRPGVLEVPRNPWRGKLFFGLALAALFLFLRLASGGFPAGFRGPDPGRAGVGWFSRLAGGVLYLGQAGLGLFFGSVGLILFFMTFFTNHDYTWHNANVIFVNPLFLAAVPLGLAAAFGKDERRRIRAGGFLKALCTYVLLGGLLTVILRLFPGFSQRNEPTQALILPVALVLSFAPDWTGRLFGGKAKP